MIPFVGYIKSTDRKSLRTLQEDLEDYTRKVVNLETGQLFLREEVRELKDCYKSFSSKGFFKIIFIITGKIKNMQRRKTISRYNYLIGFYL